MSLLENIQQGVDGDGKEEKDSDRDSPPPGPLPLVILESNESYSPRTACSITSGYYLDEEYDNEGFYNKIKVFESKVNSIHRKDKRVRVAEQPKILR